MDKANDNISERNRAEIFLQKEAEILRLRLENLNANLARATEIMRSKFEAEERLSQDFVSESRSQY
jgi:hypothetical protein